MKVAIIGGGLAGCAAAFVLRQAGHDVVIYEAGDALARGASGNSVGLYNPRFGAEWSPQSRYFSAAFARALTVFPCLDSTPTLALPLKGEGTQSGRIGFNPCGALHLITDARREKQFGKMVSAWVGGVSMRIVSKPEASDIAGIEIGHDALYLPQSGSVCPAQLCAAYARGVDVRLGARVEDVDAIDADAVILAVGSGYKGFEDLVAGFELSSVRGQVSMIEADERSAALACHLCYEGSVSKAANGRHMVGATFQRWFEHDDVRAEDDADNLERLYGAVPSFGRGRRVVASWAGVRVAARDYFPVVGQLRDRVYVSIAHGSYGILSSLMGAEVLGNMIDNKPQALSDDVLAALCPARFKR